MTNPPAVELRGVSKRYGDRESAVWALRGVSATVGAGEILAIQGPSGSGKSTLLNLIAGLDRPTGGTVLVHGTPLNELSGRALARLRRELVTFVFQFFNLLASLTAEQNVAIPLRARRMRHAEMREHVASALAAVGMDHRARHYPEELSGGELQRVAIARALATGAAVILADEPTGNLDSSRGRTILDLLERAAKDQGRTVVLVTHDPAAAARGDRWLILRDGRLADGNDAASVPPDGGGQ